MNRICYIVCFMLLVACKGNENRQEGIVRDSTMNATSRVEYTCPMHPEIVSDTPATCPRCGMELQIKS